MSSHPLTFPLYESVPAGLPFTPETGEHTPLDITNYLIEHPASTYLVRVRGESMQERGILSGDIVVVDRARIARSGDIVIASFSGAVTLKILEKETGVIRLLPANPAYRPITVDEECEIIGVIVGAFRKYN